MNHQLLCPYLIFACFCFCVVKCESCISRFSTHIWAFKVLSCNQKGL